MNLHTTFEELYEYPLPIPWKRKKKNYFKYQKVIKNYTH